MKILYLLCTFLLLNSVNAQNNFKNIKLDSIPADLPLPIVKISSSPSKGYLFASVPYWGKGNHYLVIYNIKGEPVFYRKTNSLCTDFKLHKNGLFTYFDYAAKKYYAMDSTMALVDSFWVQNDFVTDEHDIKFLNNGNVLLIGLNYKLVDMSKYVDGGERNASVVLNVIQEIDSKKNVVFEWKSDEHYQYTDTADRINLKDLSFIHCHLNSLEVDGNGNLLISARNLDEITKIERKTGKIIWRFGGKNNQFKFVNDSLGFSAQHSVSILKNGNILVYDNGLDHTPQHARAIEYKLDEDTKTAAVVWIYRNQPDIISNFWGNVQRLESGNTFISWGFNQIAATEIDENNNKVYEIEFPQDVYSYRIYKFNFDEEKIVSVNKPSEVFNSARLYQNYPNPFNPVTTIRFAIPSTAKNPNDFSSSRVSQNYIQNVTLKVFDQLGKLVATLVNESKSPGAYEVKFDISNLPAGGRGIANGVYFYRLQYGNYTQTKKLIILK